MAPKDVLVGVQLLFLILDAVVLGLRLFVRTRLNKAIGYDDYTMVVAFVSTGDSGRLGLLTNQERRPDTPSYAVWGLPTSRTGMGTWRSGPVRI